MTGLGVAKRYEKTEHHVWVNKIVQRWGRVSKTISLVAKSIIASSTATSMASICTEIKVIQNTKYTINIDLVPALACMQQCIYSSLLQCHQQPRNLSKLLSCMNLAMPIGFAIVTASIGGD